MKCEIAGCMNTATCFVSGAGAPIPHPIYARNMEMSCGIG